MDEFYGGYNYTSQCDGSVVSAADNIIDVDSDDVLIIDGLTKRFRLPGWVNFLFLSQPFSKKTLTSSSALPGSWALKNSSKQ